MIEISHLTKKFDQFVAVDDLSFSVKELLAMTQPSLFERTTTG